MEVIFRPLKMELREHNVYSKPSTWAIADHAIHVIIFYGMYFHLVLHCTVKIPKENRKKYKTTSSLSAPLAEEEEKKRQTIIYFFLCIQVLHTYIICAYSRGPFYPQYKSHFTIFIDFSQFVRVIMLTFSHAIYLVAKTIFFVQCCNYHIWVVLTLQISNA